MWLRTACSGDVVERCWGAQCAVCAETKRECRLLQGLHGAGGVKVGHAWYPGAAEVGNRGNDARDTARGARVGGGGRGTQGLQSWGMWENDACDGGG